jgi:predicted NBD/HSP70 family sugar kinase
VQGCLVGYLVAGAHRGKGELIVIGGDLATAGEPLFEPMRRTLERGVMGSHARGLRIAASTLGDSAGVRGAAALILDDAPRLLSTA